MIVRRTRRPRILILLLLLALLIGTAWMVIRRGFSAREAPSAIEVFIARGVRRWAVPAKMHAMTNPVAPTPEVLADARAHFADHCATCHGNDGKGNALGKQMSPRAPDMTLAATQSMSDGELFAIIEDGIRMTGMPAFGDGTPQSTRSSWALVHFIRRLPKLTAADVAAMEKMNPRSPEEWEAMREEEEFLKGGGGSTEHHDSATPRP